MTLNETAVKIAVKVIKMHEGCILYSYPDPASPLYQALSNNNMLHKFLTGELRWRGLPKNFQTLSGSPWSAMYGETEGIEKEMTFTQAQADQRLERRVREFMEGAIKISPELAKLSPEKIAAVTSFCYNIGLGNYKTSTVAKKIAEKDFKAAADAFLLWNKAKGKIMSGLVKRREIERNLFLAS